MVAIVVGLNFDIDNARVARQTVQAPNGTVYVASFERGGANTLAMFKGNAKPVTSFAEQDSGNRPTDTASRMSMAIDTAGIIHILYFTFTGTDRWVHVTFNTNTDLWGSTETIQNEIGGGATNREGHISIDSNDIPHVVFPEEFNTTDEQIFYSNRIGGTWKTPVQVDSTTAGGIYRPPAMVIGIPTNAIGADRPIITYHVISGDYFVRHGDALDATSFGTVFQVAPGEIQTQSAISMAGATDNSVHINFGGVTDGIGYRKHDPADVWTDWGSLTLIDSTVNYVRFGITTVIGNPYIFAIQNEAPNQNDIILWKDIGAGFVKTVEQTTADSLTNVRPKYAKYGDPNPNEVDYAWKNNTGPTNNGTYFDTFTVVVPINLEFDVDAIVLDVGQVLTTVDAILLADQTDTSLVDAILIATTNSAFDVDAILIGVQTDTSLVDAFVLATTDLDFVVDANAQIMPSENYSVDAFLREDDKTFGFTVDAVLVNRIDDDSLVDATLVPSPLLFIVDAVLGGAVSFDVDAIVIVRNADEFDVDAIPVTRFDTDFTVDADLRQFPRNRRCTFNDALLQATFDQDFTVDAIIIVNLLDYTVDATLVDRFDDTSLVDAFLLATQDNDYTVDALIQTPDSIMFSVDAFLEQETDLDYTVDAIISSRLTDTSLVDSILITRKTFAYTVDALLELQTDLDFTVDANVELATSQNYSVDAFLELETDLDFTVDAVVVERFTDTSTVDSIVINRETETFLVDAFIGDLFFEQFTCDAILLATFTDTSLVDAFVELTQTDTSLVDAFVLAETDLDFTVDANVQQMPSNNYTVDAFVQETKDLQYTVDSFIRLQIDNDFTVDARLAVRTLYTLDAFLRDVKTFGFTVDARIPTPTQEAFTVDSILIVRQTTDFTLDATVSLAKDLDFTVDALLSGVLLFTVDAFIRTKKGESFQVDSILSARKLNDFNVDAIVFQIPGLEFTVDAFILQETDGDYSVDAIIKALGTNLDFTVDGNIEQVPDLQFTVDAIIFQIPLSQFSVDAVLSAPGILFYTVDAFLQADQQTHQFTVDANLPGGTTKIFAVDAFLRATLLNEFLVDSILDEPGFALFIVDAIILLDQSCSFPDEDISNVGAWSPEPLWQEIDTFQCDGAFVTRFGHPDPAGSFEVGLENLGEPPTNQNHIITIVARTDKPNDHFKVRGVLKQDGTVVKATTPYFSLESTTFTKFKYTLSGPEADAISNYMTLSVEIQTEVFGQFVNTFTGDAVLV